MNQIDAFYIIIWRVLKVALSFPNSILLAVSSFPFSSSSDLLTLFVSPFHSAKHFQSFPCGDQSQPSFTSRISILFPFRLGFAYLSASKLANKVYQRQTAADLTWVIMLSIIFLTIFSTFVSLYFYGNSFVMIMLMIWALQYPTDTINIFGAQILSAYLPILYPTIMIALGSSYKNYMAGFLFGLLLGVIKNPNYMREHGDLLPTPNFLKPFFKHDAYQAEKRRIEEVRAQQSDRYFQGTGYRLS